MIQSRRVDITRVPSRCIAGARTSISGTGRLGENRISCLFSCFRRRVGTGAANSSVLDATLTRVSVAVAEPGVPVVDLPRVNAVQFQMYDHTVGAHLVTDDEAMSRWIDELRSAPPATVAADIETRGLDVNKFTITCVTVAFHLGGDTVSLLLDPLRRPEHRGMLERVFDHAERLIFHGASFDIAPLYAHRLVTRAHIRKLGDTLVAARMLNTNAKAGRALEDLATKYQVMNDDRTTMTEVFAARGLKKDDGWWATDIDTPTYVVGAMSDTVATLRLWGVPGVNGHGIMAEAARYLTTRSAGFGGMGQLSAAEAETVVNNVQRVNAIVLERTARGYAVDREFPERFIAENRQKWVEAGKILVAANIRPGVGADLVKVLDSRGELPQPWPRTPTGQLKADKKALEVFTAENAEYHNDLVNAHRTVATSEKVLGYVTKVVENSSPTGRLHPEIKILGANATGRMCLPEDQLLLTRRGVVAVGDIRTGDRTLDADGNWTTVREVHRYPDAPVRRYTLPDGTVLTCTPEHRWVTVDPENRRTVLPLADADPRSAMRLVPTPEEPSDQPDAHEMFLVRTLAEAGAASGQMALEEAHRRTMITAGDQERDLTDSGALLRQMMRAHGMPADDSKTMMLETPPTACAGYIIGLTEVADRRTSSGEDALACGNDLIRDAAAIALYRTGLSCAFGEDEYGPYVVPRHPDFPVREISVEDAGTADVWCVTTDSGTFTAWGEHGPYLTGNSASKPEVQQFPKEARGVILADDGSSDLISADWKSIEPVVMATASGDRQFLDDMRAGRDPYEPVGKMAGVARKPAKIIMLANMYGQGWRNLALANNWTEERAKQVLRDIRRSLPTLYKLIDALRAQSENIGYVNTLTGRVLDQRFTSKEGPEIAASAAANHFCQGSALDVMHHSILELDRRGLSDKVHLWMHDEIVGDKDIQDELVDVMATPPPFLEAVASEWNMNAFLAVDVNGMGRRWEYV